MTVKLYIYMFDNMQNLIFFLNLKCMSIIIIPNVVPCRVSSKYKNPQQNIHPIMIPIVGDFELEIIKYPPKFPKAILHVSTYTEFYGYNKTLVFKPSVLTTHLSNFPKEFLDQKISRLHGPRNRVKEREEK